MENPVLLNITNSCLFLADRCNYLSGRFSFSYPRWSRLLDDRCHTASQLLWEETLHHLHKFKQILNTHNQKHYQWWLISVCQVVDLCYHVPCLVLCCSLKKIIKKKFELFLPTFSEVSFVGSGVYINFLLSMIYCYSRVSVAVFLVAGHSKYNRLGAFHLSKVLMLQKQKSVIQWRNMVLKYRIKTGLHQRKMTSVPCIKISKHHKNVPLTHPVKTIQNQDVWILGMVWNALQ